MNLIAAADENWAIGKDNHLLVSIPKDQKLFRDETLGKVVIMGRKTLESLPGGQPLYGRKTIVLTRDPEFQAKGVTICHNVEEVLDAVKDTDPDDVFVAGGQQVYEALLPYCTVAHVTYIDYAYEADTHFVDLDQDPQWVMDVESDEETYFDLCYTFRRYVKKEQV